MNPEPLSLYTDEDVANAVAESIRRRGFAVSTTPERGHFALQDVEQLLFAHSIGAVLLTHNVRDFPRIHYEFMQQNLSHSGILVARQVSIGEIVKSFLRLAAALSSTEMENRLEYLSAW